MVEVNEKNRHNQCLLATGGNDLKALIDCRKMRYAKGARFQIGGRENNNFGFKKSRQTERASAWSVGTRTVLAKL